MTRARKASSAKAAALRSAQLPEVPDRRGGIRRVWRKAWILREHPKGWLSLGMRSRLAPYFVRGFALLPVIYASGPDKWKSNTPVFVLILAVLITGAELLRTLVHGTEKSAQASAFQTIGHIISRLAGTTTRNGAPAIAHDPGETIETLLRRGKDVVESGLKPAAADWITASLFLPVANSRGKVNGLQAAQHDDFYPDRACHHVPLDAPGVGGAFSRGEWSVVEDTEEETSGHYRERAYRSVAAFPILVELGGGRSLVTGVVTFDSALPYTFTWRSVRELASYVHPIVQLIGLALELRNQEKC